MDLEISCNWINLYFTKFDFNKSVELKVDSTAGLVKSSINKVVDQANNSDLQMGVSFLQESGIEDTLLSQLPKNIELKTSYQGLNQLSTNYLANGKLVASDLKLNNDTQQEQVLIS